MTRKEFPENHLSEKLPRLNKNRVTLLRLDKVQPNQNNENENENSRSDIKLYQS